MDGYLAGSGFSATAGGGRTARALNAAVLASERAQPLVTAIKQFGGVLMPSSGR